MKQRAFWRLSMMRLKRRSGVTSKHVPASWWKAVSCKQIDAPAPEKPKLTLTKGERTAWRAPEFDEYTDMWELIKLDPIHEVEEAGWPIRKA